MEVLEIYNYDISDESETVEVFFRLTTDSEDEGRVAIFDFDTLTEYGIELINDSDMVFDDYEDDYDFFFDDDISSVIITPEDLMNFLNEYYMVNPKEIPEKSFI